MFNKKLLNILCWIMAVMLVAKLALDLILFIWAYFAAPSLNPELVKVLQEIAGIGQVIFIYIIVAAVRNIVLTAKK
jgi:hypothetical protein